MAARSSAGAASSRYGTARGPCDDGDDHGDGSDCSDHEAWVEVADNPVIAASQRFRKKRSDKDTKIRKQSSTRLPPRMHTYDSAESVELDDDHLKPVLENDELLSRLEEVFDLNDSESDQTGS